MKTAFIILNVILIFTCIMFNQYCCTNAEISYIKGLGSRDFARI